MAFARAPEPKSLLGYRRILSPTCGLRVSPLILGGMNFGDAWRDWLGDCSKDEAFRILDFYYENGGNFIDTANNYQDEQSEKWIGEWLAERGVRDQMVVATKFSNRISPNGARPIQANEQGNHAKSLITSLEASLQKLQTSYVDILYLHWQHCRWDFTTSIEEVMQALNRMVQNGKVLYLGVSDTPAWVVSRANQYARDHGMAQFVVYQGRWSAAVRDAERELLPMCRSEGMAFAAWGAMGGGAFRSEQDRKAVAARSAGLVNDPVYIKVSRALEQVAKRKSASITQVALAYVMQKTPYVFPVIGGRKVEHLESNIGALRICLHQEDLDEIDDANTFDLGFPMGFLYGLVPEQKYRLGAPLDATHSGTILQHVPQQEAIKFSG
ncbi:hypothetical protein FOXG_02647 [Fusarium oxysporum f. sp. lycopersici 4287]|uniref:NADP-dependent oxidoreductase domain-containing protein n=2 Tax=Fusarium oxysporum TaxID=5507 RepID=A0A0J9UFT7_FUSO4|nr:hypothetical protein FOXG_02647 [Fusarium oxysporum f. sp. lycopersici 4287]EXK27417.1 hypothetical protein FOMG_16223 [Fusarium oxysporum f. sp. melonis 26406]KAJ9425951.1 NADP-dependent oxidoreductase domain-containing protein [Fusarium oxysporum]KNA98258.1 hypothetical protein FOXG_02647 [Fusarium oxysporum f. sp. lycopersici 4287]